MTRATRILLAGLATLLAAGPLGAADTDLHELRWYVHTDMVTLSHPISFWQDFIEEATVQTETLLKGNQGSGSYADEPCCTEITALSVGEFGIAGDGLDEPAASDFTLMRARIHGGDPGGSVAFLVLDITLCGGSGSAIGCATIPFCNTNANDDPDLEFMVSVEAMEDDDSNGIPEGVGDMAQTLAHERGHNACRGHTTGNSCDLMSPSGSGGCLTAVECVDFQEARTTTTQGDPCDCHASGGGLEDDGDMCTEGATLGLCSGGVCSESSGGQVELLAAGAPEAAEISAPLDETTDDLLRMSDVPGGWLDGADFADDIQGMAYDPDRGVVWGVLDDGTSDDIVTIDPATGAVTSTLVSLPYSNVIAMAFHPGSTTAGTDDHLLVNAAEDPVDCDLIFNPMPDFCSGDLIEVDPDTGSHFKVGDMQFTFVGGLRGLAWDSQNGILYGSAFAGGSLWTFTNLSCGSTSCSCPSGFCTMAEETAVDLPRVVSGLAYSPDTNRLYLVGTQSGPQLLYDSIDADTFASEPSVGVEDYTPGGLAAVPLPEPGRDLAGLLGVAALAGFCRRRGDVRN